MDQDLVRRIVRLDDVVGNFEGHEYEVRGNAGLKKVRVDSEFYTVVGNQRLRVMKSTEQEFNGVSAGKAVSAKNVDTTPASQKVAKKRKKSEPKVVEPRKCEVTGEMFTPSKFQPYATVSPEGRKILNDQKKKSLPGPRKCEVTGEEFTPSKFNPYATVSPEGRKILRRDSKKDEQVSKAFERARELTGLAGYSDEVIRDAIDKAWNEGITSYPSLVKAVRVHFNGSTGKAAKPTGKVFSPEEVVVEG